MSVKVRAEKYVRRRPTAERVLELTCRILLAGGLGLLAYLLIR